MAVAVPVDTSCAPAPDRRVVERAVGARRSRNIASRKPTSPTRLVTNAFLPATAAALRSNQNEMSR